MQNSIINIKDLSGSTDLKSMIESGHINFLIGSGASSNFLKVLGDIETNLANPEITPEEKETIYKEYFTGVMSPCLHILNNGETLDPATKQKLNQTSEGYKEFFRNIVDILLSRKTSIINKQANIFTTNIDIFMEKSLEGLGVDYNDGFQGQITPKFSLSNFQKMIHKTSHLFDISSEIPLINIFKIHGSLNRVTDNDKILYSKLEQVQKTLDAIDGDFSVEFEKLSVVNPEKDKFRNTVLNLNYYELLRMYAGELEKANSILFVIGFSMADEHIREITLRCANSNPTLKIFIFQYSGDGEALKTLLNIDGIRYKNVSIVIGGGETKLNIETITDTIFSKTLTSNDD